MRLQLPVAAVLAVLGAGWCAAADSTTTTDPSITTSSDAKDQRLSPQQFVERAASAGLFEVQSSQLALTKGVDAKTRDLAQMMVTDHQKANQELQGIASRKGLTVPQTIDSDQQKQLDKLRSASGDDFSRQYLKVQSKAHEDAVALFGAASKDLQDPELKQFAAKTLPTLRTHLDHVSMLKVEEKTSMNDASQGGSQSGSLGSSDTSGGWSSRSSIDQGSSSSSDQGSQSGSAGSQSDMPANQGSSSQSSSSGRDVNNGTAGDHGGNGAGSGY